MKLVEGQLIHRRYRLDRRLAQGGMGEVWKGHDIQLNRPVAIKALRDDQGNVEAKLHRLRAEAHNSANLAHPNIAALFEYYEHDSIGFLIMEYVPSDSLADIYRDRGTLPATELLPILIQTARGLFVAHSHGVIHRDVKPANIMVSTTGEVKSPISASPTPLTRSRSRRMAWSSARAVHLPPSRRKATGHAAIRHLLAGRRRVRRAVRASAVHRHHAGRHRRRTRQRPGAPAAGFHRCAASAVRHVDAVQGSA